MVESLLKVKRDLTGTRLNTSKYLSVPLTMAYLIRRPCVLVGKWVAWVGPVTYVVSDIVHDGLS